MIETIRIAQVLGSSAGGVARHVAQVSAALVGDGFQVLVAGPESVRSLAQVPGAAFHPVEISDRPKLGDVTAVRTLRRLAGQAEVMHGHGLRAGALLVFAARSLPRAKRPRIVVTLHNLPVGARTIRAVSAVLERIVGRGADVVLGVSGDLVSLAGTRGARVTERALVPAPPGVGVVTDAATVREALGLKSGQRLLVTVGRLAPQKDLGTLCTAAGLLAGQTTQPIVWVIAGGGPLAASTQDRIDAENLPVRLLGPRSDAADLLAAADVVVSSALWEGQPLGIQEALRLGAAVVATDAGGTSEVTGSAATLVPVGDAAALARGIAKLLDNSQTLAAARADALARAAQLPTLEDAIAQLHRVYRTPVQSPKAN